MYPLPSGPSQAFLGAVESGQWYGYPVYPGPPAALPPNQVAYNASPQWHQPLQRPTTDFPPSTHHRPTLTDPSQGKSDGLVQHVTVSSYFTVTDACGSPASDGMLLHEFLGA